MLQAAPATRDGSATLTVEGGESPKAVDDTKASRIVMTRQSANPFDAAVVVDGDPVTAWSATPGATPHEAYVVPDLGKPRASRSARWLEAPDELSGTLRVEVSTNGKRWQKAAGREQAATDPWQDLRLKHSVETRYVRMLFTNPTGAPLLGGPAEVEIRLAAHAEAQRHGPKAERHRGKAEHGKVRAGNQHTESKDQKVKMDQHQGHNDRNGRKNHKTGEVQTPPRAAGTRRVTFQLPTRAVGSKEDNVTLPLMVRSEKASAGTGDGGAFWAVVPAGGSGTRLWPLSRSAHPKFLLPLLGDRSLLQWTADRLEHLAPPERTFIVCGPAHGAPVSEQLPHFPATSLIVEPTPRGSGPAISLAAAIIARRDPEAIMGSFAADHDVRDNEAFSCAVRVAIEAAKADWLVTIGLSPVRPETGYGYIESTEETIVTTVDGSAFRTMRFVEKPDLATATTYVESGRFLWNASMFIWKIRTFLNELARLQPALHLGVTQIAAAWGTPEQDQVVAEIWPTLPESTIDQGVMERTPRVAVVPAEMGWSDVGDWHGLGELLDHDENGFSGRADLVNLRSRDSLVWSETKRVIALVGLANIVVIDTPDALLIANRSDAQEVRGVVGALTQSMRSELL